MLSETDILNWFLTIFFLLALLYITLVWSWCTSFRHLAFVWPLQNNRYRLTADELSVWPKVSCHLFYYSVYSTHESTWGLPTLNSVLNSCCQINVWKRHAEVMQLTQISPKLPWYSGSQWGVRALETLVELVSEKIINSSVMLTVFSETCMSPENFFTLNKAEATDWIAADWRTGFPLPEKLRMCYITFRTFALCQSLLPSTFKFSLPHDIVPEIISLPSIWVPWYISADRRSCGLMEVGHRC